MTFPYRCFRSVTIATLALVASGALPAQSLYPYTATISNGAVMDWQGESLVLLWAFDGQPLVRLQGVDKDFNAIAVKLQVVGFAVHDPRPCATGITVRLSSMAYTSTALNTRDAPPCGLVLETNIGPDGFAWLWPPTDQQPVLEPCWETTFYAPDITYGAHYCTWTVPNSASVIADCATPCGPDDKWPAISFLLVRPIIG